MIAEPEASDLLSVARTLRSHRVYLFYKHAAHFCNPLVPAEWKALQGDPVLVDEQVRRVVLELLPEQLPSLEAGIYSPVPIARGLAEGRSLASLLADFRYEMIQVDEDQRWTWQGRPVATKVRAFLLENLAYEPALELYYFEYKVNADWWDKSYLETATTPLTARTLGLVESGARVDLDNLRSDLLVLETFRLDDRERLYCETAEHGEVMLSDSVRFSLLSTVNEACDALQVGEAWYPLRWPE